LDTRTWHGKLRQALAALALELRYTKRDLLEAYLNLAPYGGNVEGAGAASLVYFGKDPLKLSVTEALTLAVLPQSPRRRDPSRNAEELAAARSRLFERWVAR